MNNLTVALCAFVAAGALSGAAVADEFVIDTDVFTTNGGNTLDGADAITVTDDGSVSVVDDFIYGLNASGNDNTVINNGSVSTTGDFAYGMVAVGDGSTVTNSGTVSTTGDSAYGLYAYGDDNTVTNSGSVTTTSNYSYGLLVEGASNTVTNSGSMSTTGVSAFGLGVFGELNTLTNDGTVTTTGDSAYGLFALGTDNTVINDGSVSTTGDYANGLGVAGELNTLTNDGTVTTTGDFAYGLYASGNDNTVINDGSVSTTGDDADGMWVGGDSNTVTNSGTVSTTGESAYGLYAFGDFNTVTNSDSVTTTSNYSYGLLVEGDSNTVTNSGSVSTAGYEAFGLGVWGELNTLTNDGTVTTTNDFGYGLHAYGDDNTLSNNASVSTTGIAGHGLYAYGDFNTLTNSGSVSTTEYGADGLYAFGDFNTLTNSGTVTISGTEAAALHVLGLGNTITNNGDLILASEEINDDGHGVFIGSDMNTLINNKLISAFADGEVYIIEVIGNGNTVTNDGTLVTETETVQVQYSYGVELDGDDNTFTNNGSIRSVSGIGGQAWGATADGSNNTITNHGSIYVNSDDTSAEAVTLRFGSNNHFINTGSVTFTSASGQGVAVYSTVDATTTVTNSGSIIAFEGLSVQMRGADATLNLDQGSVLFGDVEFGDAATATLNFGAGLNAVVHTDGAPDTITSQGVYVVDGDTIINTDISDLTAQNRASSTVGRMIVDAVSSRSVSPVTSRGMGGAGTWSSVTGNFINNAGDDDAAGYRAAIVSGSFGKDRGDGGLFAGVSLSGVTVDDGAQTNSIGVQGGVYGLLGSAEYLVAAGLTYNDVERTQANNAVEGGLESASATYMSAFVSPALTWTGLLGGNDSLRLRYTGLWSDGQEFSFQDNDLEIGSGFSHQVEARAAWQRQMETGVLNYGLDLGWQNSASVDVTIAGNSLSGTVPGENTYGRVFVGMDYAAGRVEVGYDSNKDLSASAQYSWRF